jgi:hypothetical protein
MGRMLGVVFGLCAVMLMPSRAMAVLGDLDRDGDVDFDDFFSFADNFGKSGPPATEVVYDTLTVEVQNVVTSYDTLVIDHATIFDTIIFGREEIRYDPPPPRDEITTALTMQTSLFNIRVFDFLIGEIRNGSGASVEGIALRLTVRDDNGVVSGTEVYQYSLPQLLVRGDTRPFRISLSDDFNMDHVRAGNYTLDLSWDSTVEEINNVTVQLDTSALGYGDPFTISGEITNTSNLAVDSFTIYFYGKNSAGNAIYYESYSENEFGISPGGRAPFSIDEVAIDYGGPYTMKSDLAELHYYIKWQWTTSSYGDYEETPLLRLF